MLFLEKLKALTVFLKFLGNENYKTEGIKMNIEDCFFKNLINIEGYFDKVENVLKDNILSIFGEISSYKKGCIGKDLFLFNKEILTKYSQFNEQFSKNCSIKVVSNPFNSFSTIVREIVANSTVIYLTSLDEERDTKSKIIMFIFWEIITILKLQQMIGLYLIIRHCAIEII